MCQLSPQFLLNYLSSDYMHGGQGFIEWKVYQEMNQHDVGCVGWAGVPSVHCGEFSMVPMPRLALCLDFKVMSELLDLLLAIASFHFGPLGCTRDPLGQVGTHARSSCSPARHAYGSNLQ